MWHVVLYQGNLFDWLILVLIVWLSDVRSTLRLLIITVDVEPPFFLRVLSAAHRLRIVIRIHNVLSAGCL